MKAFFLTIPLLLVASAQTIGQPMPKSSKTITASSEEPKTISDMVGEVRELMKHIKLQFKPGTTDDEIIFGLQHTIADQRQPDSEKGKAFPVTTEYFPKIVNYYKAFVAAIPYNQSDMELLPLFVDALQDMTITGEESGYISRTSREILARTKQDARLGYRAEAIREHPTEVNKDPRLLALDKDGENEVIAFVMDGKETVFMKQYLASLLEPIREATEAARNQDSNKALPKGQITTEAASIVKNN